VLSSELEHTQTQLLDKTELATRLQREISELRGDWQREAASWREREAELKQNLHHGDVLRHSLSQQVERSNMELNSLSGRLSEQQRAAREMKKSQNDLEMLRRHTIEVESEKEHIEAKFGSLKEEKQKLLVDLGQEKTRNAKLAGKLKQLERQLGGEVGRREEGEGRATQMKEELERVRRDLEKERERIAEVEIQAREKESTVEDTLGHMQQELSKRAQQVGRILYSKFFF
jgi:chromosome segregation ATPase